MMFEDFEYKGLWWLPENPSNKVHGTLTFEHANRISLDLERKFGVRHEY